MSLIKKKMELRNKNSLLASLREKIEKFNTREADVEKMLDEAKTDEELNAVQTELDELEKERPDIETAEADKARLEQEIALLEQQLAEARNTQQDLNNKEGKRNMAIYSRLQVRSMVKDGTYFENAEVREFYDGFKNLRTIDGGDLTIPNIVVNRIMDIMGDYTTVYPLVDKIHLNGTARILIDTDTEAATWMEQKSSLPAGNVGTITNIDFDGFKVGKITFVDNSLLQDSIINLDDYVTKKIARSIAMALDAAILNGKGSASKQPEGIITDLDETHKVEAIMTDDYRITLANIIKPLSLIDTGKDSVGEIVAVMSRATYYNRIAWTSIHTNEGNVVAKLPNMSTPDILGIRIVFNNNIDNDKILFGDYSKYTLIERESISVSYSSDYKFGEDQMAYRGKGRFDGKPTNKDAFVLVTLTEAAE